MDIYGIPVVLAIAALIAQVRRNRQADLVVVSLAALAIALIAGLRWYSDVDYGPYADLFQDTPTLGGYTRALGGLYGEPGYLLVASLFRTLGMQFGLLALACSLVSVFLKSLVASSLSRHASLSVCLYLCLHFVTIEFIQMRWAVATGLLCLGFYWQYRGGVKAAVACYVGAVFFHYFSLVFGAVAVAVAVGGYRRFQVLFVAAFAMALLVNGAALSHYFVTDSTLYVLQRLNRYAEDPASHVGFFSYTKILMYPAIYQVCVWCNPRAPWRTDPRNLFLFRLALTALSLTLAVSFIPQLHFRATVIADFFAILWILNALDVALSAGARTAAYAGLTALYCLWYVLDVNNYINAGRLYDYHTWLTALR